MRRKGYVYQPSFYQNCAVVVKIQIFQCVLHKNKENATGKTLTLFTRTTDSELDENEIKTVEVVRTKKYSKKQRNSYLPFSKFLVSHERKVVTFSLEYFLTTLFSFLVLQNWKEFKNN